MSRFGMHAAAALLAAGLAGGGLAELPQAGTTVVSFFDLQTEVPDTWVSEEPTSSMRLLQMTVPAADGGGDAELVVFFFGQGQGGDIEANVARWRSQFNDDNGGPVEPAIEHFEVNGMPVTVAELSGAYRRNVGGMPADPVAGQTLRAAIIETDRGSLFAQLHGPQATVAAQRAAFDAFVRGLRPVE